MLGSEASTVFLYSLINSSPRRNFELSKKFGTNIDYISKIDPYSARWPIGEVRQEYSENLEIIARNIRFRFFDPKQETWPEHKRVFGVTIGRVSEPVYLTNDVRREIYGTSPKVALNSNFILQLKRLRSLKPTTPDTISSIVRAQFFMAVTICHEVAHAVGFAVRYHNYVTEPIWEDHQVPELGREWEQEVFGAILKPPNLAVHPALLWASK